MKQLSIQKKIDKVYDFQKDNDLKTSREDWREGGGRYLCIILNVKTEINIHYFFNHLTKQSFITKEQDYTNVIKRNYIHNILSSSSRKKEKRCKSKLVYLKIFFFHIVAALKKIVFRSPGEFQEEFETKKKFLPFAEA